MLFRAFGLTLSAGFDLPGAVPDCTPSTPLVSLCLTDRAVVEERWSGAAGPPAWEALDSDGSPVLLERGVGGDWRFGLGGTAAFHLCAAGCRLLCGQTGPGGDAWERILLDTVLPRTSVLLGFEALRASAVTTSSGVVAFLGAPGAGKSTLAAEFVRRGHSLVSDEVLVLSRSGRELTAHAGPALMNLPVQGPVSPTEIGALVEGFPTNGTAWVEVENVESERRPLAAVYLLERRPGLDTRVVSLLPDPGRLSFHSLGLTLSSTRSGSQRALFAAIARQVPVRRLQADPSVGPAELADAVTASEAELPALAVA